MRLKRIKLAGFKSFVDTTSIPFPGEMTAVVGPNGCGKSNVIDAVRWVLGESSAKNLRGDAMTDVIFNGSTARKPVSQCSVELLFDNSSGRIQGEFANYNEIAVKRVVTRDAQSSYFLNASRCRRRDVTDLFLGTGLGPRSYAIIEQGMISRLIESKPQELRVFVEEAAGISKYKERRRDTETRMRHTRDNLERLEDVRGELSSQIEKLQRQAVAAQRYTELKNKERDLKAELAGIRWLAHANNVIQLDKKILQEETECEALVAKQRAEERDLLGYKQELAELNHTIEDLLQSQFTITTDITRIEQSQKYTNQRKQQLSIEAEEVNHQIETINKANSEAQGFVDETQAQLSALEPEGVVLAEQLEFSAAQRDAAESARSDFSQQFRRQEQTYNQLKQQAQTCHSNIQSTMAMQMRTQQRFSDITEELDSLEYDQLAEQLQTLSTEQIAVKQQCLEAEALVERRKSEQAKSSEQVLQLSSLLDQRRAEVQQIRAECEALKAIQQNAAEVQKWRKELTALTPLWKTLKVKSGFESFVDIAIQHSQNYFVVDDINAMDLHWFDFKGSGFVFSGDWESSKQVGSLAEALENASVPRFFNTIFTANNIDEGSERLKQLPCGSAIITRDGKWLAHHGVYIGADQTDGKTLRQATIDRLNLKSTELTAKITVCEADISALQEDLACSVNALNEAELALQNIQQAKFQFQNQASVLAMQLEQTRVRKQKLVSDKQAQQLLLTKEQQQLEQLSAKVAEIESQLLDYESDQLDYERQRERQDLHVRDTHMQVEQLTASKHQNDMLQQQLKGQLQNANERMVSSSKQIHQASQRLDKINEELAQLDLPVADQQTSITLLIAQREEIIATKQANTEQLNHIQLLVNNAEKDQQNLSTQIQKNRQSLEKLKLEAQEYKVRSDAVSEQLTEINQSLKDVLERLPDQAEETLWQQDLEKLQAAITRLGPVNLAAVDEYKSQAQRKQHLDAQFDDLQAALNTLEEAIRKIDKETKIRFSATFEQVNNDLKSLFPKVFGGGSAYLALTDDDLLETGVTIMARPPGKKNSTIHLLSGGEKALTALSLVFAIFRLNPAPFCLLDEVDAPLDDANVERFCRLVSEMSKTVQFIYITHNKIAMEMAEHLTGVTMAEPGVSRMVAVDVDEAVAIANV